MKSKIGFGLIAILLLTFITPTTSATTYMNNFSNLDPGQNVTWDFAPNKTGNFTCYTSAQYVNVRGIKSGIATFSWRNGTETWNTFETANLGINIFGFAQPVTTTLHSDTSDINYRISVYNPNTYKLERIPMEVHIKITS